MTFGWFVLGPTNKKNLVKGTQAKFTEIKMAGLNLVTKLFTLGNFGARVAKNRVVSAASPRFIQVIIIIFLSF